MLSGLERDHLIGETLVFAHAGLGVAGVAATTRNVANLEDVLRMVEEALRVIRLPANRLGRSGHCLAIKSLAQR